MKGTTMMLSAGLDVSAAIGPVADKLDQIHRLLQRGQVMQPHPFRVATGLSPVATWPSVAGRDPQADFTVIGDPPGGQQWEVRRISFGLNPGGTVSTAGTFIVFNGSTEIARTTTVPNFMTFSAFQCIVTPPDNLLAVWVGGVLGTNSSMRVDVCGDEFPILSEVLLQA